MAVAAVVVLLLCCAVAAHGQLSVSVLPDALFVDSGGVHDIVETAFIRLVCTASSGSAPDVEWQRNGVAATNDVPSRWIRTSTSGSTTSSVLNIASFQSTDDGTYRCVATDGGSPMNGDTVTLTAVSPTPTGTVTVVTPPEDADPVFNFDNRAPVDLTGTFTSECVGGHVGESSGSNTGLPAPPNVVWVRDGVALANGDEGGRITIVDSDQFGTPPSQKRSVLTITNFMQSDAGIYQCIFTDVDTAGEVIATTPLQVDTGATPSVQRISPANIVLVPPEKLVLEVETAGAYAVIQWTKNAIPAGSTGFEVALDNFVNYFEIFVRESTTTSDIGLYVVDLIIRPGQTEPQAVEIVVTPYVSPATTATGSSPVTLMEGQDVDISCTSSGNPIPDITWELGGSSASFNQSDSSNPLQATLDEVTADFQFTVGQQMSTLQIRSAVYPDHDGVYTCTGANSQATESGSDSATITVVVQVVNCGDLQNPDNGNVDHPTTMFGSTATYTCDSGYQLNGNIVRTCQADGLWDGSNPSCVPIQNPQAYPAAARLVGDSNGCPTEDEWDVARAAVLQDIYGRIVAQFGVVPSPLIGETAEVPATSCQQITELTPTSPSGYYWILSPGSEGQPVQVFCTFEQ